MNKHVEPLTPNELKRIACPSEVIAAFNQCLIMKWDGKSAKITQDMAINAIIDEFGNEEGDPSLVTRQDVFDNKWLDIEEQFQSYGWNVRHLIPDRGETFEAFFIFKPA